MTASNQSQKPNIEQARQLLSPYLDGEVTVEEQALVEEAMAISADLRRELETLRQTVSMVRALPPMPAPRPFTLSEADVQPAKPAPRRGFILPGWFKSWTMLAATLLCVLALGGVFLSQQFLGGVSSLAPDEIARVEEQAAEEPAAAPEMAMEAEPAEETATDQEALEVTEVPAAVAIEKETVVVEEIEEEQEAPAEEAVEGEAMMAAEAADESQAAAASEVVGSTAPEEATLDRGAAPATPTAAPTGQAFAGPSPTARPSAAKAMPAEEEPAAPPQPSLAEGGPEVVEEDTVTEKNLAQSETSEPLTPTLAPQPGPTVATPSPEPTVTPRPTAILQPEVTQPAPARPLTLLIVLGLVVTGGLVVIGLLIWLLVRKR